MRNTLRALGQWTRSLLAAALAVGALYAVSGGARLVLASAATGALVLILLNARERRQGGEREQADRAGQATGPADAGVTEDGAAERVATAEDGLTWDLDYERTLEDLVLELIGREVRVLIGARTDQWWPAAELSGTLDHAIDIAPNGHPDELLWLGVDGSGGVVLSRDAFAGSARIDDDEEIGVALRLGDNLLWILDDEASRNRAALTRERRGAL